MLATYTDTANNVEIRMTRQERNRHILTSAAYRARARDERVFSKNYWNTVESKLIHLRDAQEYEAIADALDAFDAAEGAA